MQHATESGDGPQPNEHLSAWSTRRKHSLHPLPFYMSMYCVDTNMRCIDSQLFSNADKSFQHFSGQLFGRPPGRSVLASLHAHIADGEEGQVDQR